MPVPSSLPSSIVFYEQPYPTLPVSLLPPLYPTYHAPACHLLFSHYPSLLLLSAATCLPVFFYPSSCTCMCACAVCPIILHSLFHIVLCLLLPCPFCLIPHLPMPFTCLTFRPFHVLPYIGVFFRYGPFPCVVCVLPLPAIVPVPLLPVVCVFLADLPLPLRSLERNPFELANR